MAESQVERRKRAVGAATVFAVILALAVLAEHVVLGLTPVHDGLEDIAYYSVQRVLAIRPHRDPDVVVVDISGIDRKPAPASWTALNVNPPERTQVVSRDALKKLLSKLPPTCKAIGVDFSCEDGHLIPTGPQTVLPDDPEFFKWCLDRKVGANQSIFLGVMRRAVAADGDVFGDKRYVSLGALISHPREGWELGTVRAASTAQGQWHERGSMGDRLAEALSPSGTWIPDWFAGQEAEEKDGLTLTRAYIDYHWVPALYDSRVTMTDLMAGKFPVAKAALLCFAEKGKSYRQDVISVPRMSEPYPGIYAHAALAQTLLQGPLIAVRLWPSIFMTFLAEFLVALAILRAKLKFEEDDPAGRTQEVAFANDAKLRASKRVAWGIILFAILAVPFTRVVWLGALAALVNLLLFSPAGEGSERIYEWLERRGRRHVPAADHG